MKSHHTSVRFRNGVYTGAMEAMRERGYVSLADYVQEAVVLHNRANDTRASEQRIAKTIQKLRDDNRDIRRGEDMLFRATLAGFREVFALLGLSEQESDLRIGQMVRAAAGSSPDVEPQTTEGFHEDDDDDDQYIPEHAG